MEIDTPNRPALETLIMPLILTISSQVIQGHVGNTAAAFAIERLGHEAWQVPTVILSNHPGHEMHAGFVTDVGQLREMIDVLERRGVLKSVDAVLSGYLPTTAHVEFVASTVDRIKAQNADAFYCCDPAVGDDPDGLYLKDTTANALSANLVARADLLTPNRFELSFLSGVEVSDMQTARQAAERLAGSRTGLAVAATSIPTVECNLANLLAMNNETLEESVLRLPTAPHGTGDLFAALVLGHYVNKASLPDAFRMAVKGVEAVLAASTGQDDLELSASQDAWATSFLSLATT